MTAANHKLWEPSAERVADARMTAFMRAVEAAHSRVDSRLRHSLAMVGRKSRALLAHGVEFLRRDRRSRRRDVADGARMPGAQWFPEGRLNFAENCLRKRDADDALVFRGEDKVKRRLSRDELYAQVSRAVQAMQADGVDAGDRVAAICPTCPRR